MTVGKGLDYATCRTVTIENSMDASAYNFMQMTAADNHERDASHSPHLFLQRNLSS